MNLKQIAKDTAKTLQRYFTYQAIKTVLAQLSQTNPPQWRWLNNFSADKIQDGEALIEQLFHEKPEFALRIMSVRENIAEEVAEFLPEMLITGIQQANMEYHRQHLERITQLNLSTTSQETEQQANPDSNLDGSSD